MSFKNLLVCLLLVPLLQMMSCGQSEECGPNPGCPGAFYVENGKGILQFQLLDTNDNIINLPAENVEEINWIRVDTQENRITSFDTVQNTGVVFILASENDIYSGNEYLLETDFGPTQTIQTIIADKPLFDDECNPCIQYFISTIVQNGTDTLFNGDLSQSDLISITVD